MQIIGFNFEKISAERKTALKTGMQISSNLNIKSIIQENIDFVKEQASLKITFEYSILYKPNIAEVVFNGYILILAEKQAVKEIMKKWKNKKISDEIRLPLLNFIMTKCNIKALQLEEEFSLPPHIPLPKIKPQQNNTNYAG